MNKIPQVSNDTAAILQVPIKFPAWVNFAHSQAVRNIVQTFLELFVLKEFAGHLLGLHAPATEPGFRFLSAARGVPMVSHPSSTLPAQCRLISVFECELVFPRWYGPLT